MTVRRLRVRDIVALERVAATIDPFESYRSIGIRSFGKGIFHYEAVPGADLPKLRFFQLRPGRLVISNIKGWEGAIALSTDADAGCVASNRFLTYIADPAQADARYLRYFFLSEAGLPLIQRASPGSADRNRTLAIDRFEALEIPLPDIGEQHRVAARLDSLFASLNHWSELANKSATFEKAMLPAGRAATFASETLHASSARLEEIATLVMGQSPPGHAYNQSGDGTPLLNGPTEFGPASPVPRQWTSSPTKLCQPGDLLMCVRGATTGRMNWAADVYCIGRGLAALRTDPRRVSIRYLRQALQAAMPSLLRRTAGSTFANLPGDRLASFEVPLPSLPKQHAIARGLDDLEKRVSRLSDLRSRATAVGFALRASLLNRAFAGLP